MIDDLQKLSMAAHNDREINQSPLNIFDRVTCQGGCKFSRHAEAESCRDADRANIERDLEGFHRLSGGGILHHALVGRDIQEYWLACRKKLVGKRADGARRERNPRRPMQGRY